MDEETAQFAGYSVSLLVLSLVLLAQLQDLLDLVPLESNLRLKALA